MHNTEDGATANVIDLTEYIKLKRNLEKQGKPFAPDQQDQFNQRVIRIRESIARIDRLMKELRSQETQRVD